MSNHHSITRLARVVAPMVLANAAIVLILVMAFAPHLLPFMSKAPSATFAEVLGNIPQTESQAPAEIISGKPTRLIVPEANIDIDVADGVYNQEDQSWTLSSDRAHYATVTPLANNAAGNTFIYGHNRRAVFAPMMNLQPGATAVVHTDNGQVFTYVLQIVHDVDPYDTSVFQYNGAPILTLQTCSGNWYENRRLFTFDLVYVESAS